MNELGASGLKMRTSPRTGILGSGKRCREISVTNKPYFKLRWGGLSTVQCPVQWSVLSGPTCRIEHPIHTNSAEMSAAEMSAEAERRLVPMRKDSHRRVKSTKSKQKSESERDDMLSREVKEDKNVQAISCMVIEVTRRVPPEADVVA